MLELRRSASTARPALGPEGVVTNYRYTWRHGWAWIWNYIRHGKLIAAGRQVWWVLIRGYDGEGCWFCGRPYMLWWAPDDLWVEFSGNSGLCCPACFDKRAERAGVTLHWKPERFTEYLARDELLPRVSDDDLVGKPRHELIELLQQGRVAVNQVRRALGVPT